jgi:hypothetical protein
MTTKMIGRALAASVALTCFWAGQADAQSYFARERLVGVPTTTPVQDPPAEPTYTYVASHSGTYGTCTNGSKSQTIVKCTRSDRTVVANSFCSSQIRTIACGTTCATMLQSRWVDTDTTPGTWKSGKAASAVAAQTWCNANKPEEYVGSCFWDSRDNSVQVAKSGWEYFGNSALYASSCR